MSLPPFIQVSKGKEKLTMKQNRKNTLLAIGFTALALSMTGCAKLELVNSKHQVELGEKYTLKVEDFVDKTKTDVDKVEVKIDLPKTFDKEGSYKGVLSVKGLFSTKEEPIEVVCKDTVAPTFTDKLPKEIKVEQNAKGIEWLKYFDEKTMATDLQEVTLSVSGENKVNLAKAGEYSITATATDKSGNKAETKVSVIVVASKMVQKGQELTAYRTGQTPISESTEKAVVEKGLTVGTGKVLVNGKEASKGSYSTDKKQKEYKARLKKQAEEEARKKREAEERERQRQQALAQQQQQSYQQPTQSVSGGNSNNSQAQTGNKGGNTTNKPSGNINACVPNALPSNVFYTKKEALSYVDEVMFADGFGEHKIKSYNVDFGIGNCGNITYTVTFNYY